ncbi:MAG: hypothetical protein HN904_26425 [Victivallales bacterium]|nr:hypothetical protein [Victivallales bacterium]
MKTWTHILPALALGITLAVTGCKKEQDQPAGDATTNPAEMAANAGGGVEYCDFAAGPEAAPIKVVAYYPGGHEETLATVKALLKQYPDKVHVRVVDWRHEEGRALKKAAGLSCAGVTINGNHIIEIARDGKKESISFTKGLSKGEWAVEDLKAAVDQELAKAGK